jgi:peptide/nickel transport system ATP-binding protein
VTAGLQAVGVSVAFGATVVLDGVDVRAGAGAITGITGASGSGKTTLLRVLAGLLRPDAGRVLYHGIPTAPRGSIALLAQHPRRVCNPRWTLRQILLEPAVIKRESVVLDDVTARIGLDAELLDRYPGQVSDGQLQRVCLGRVLIQEASTVLCDEPTAMLDPIASGSVMSLLREIADGGATVVLVSHDPALIQALTTDSLVLTRRP